MRDLYNSVDDLEEILKSAIKKYEDLISVVRKLGGNIYALKDKLTKVRREVELLEEKNMYQENK